MKVFKKGCVRKFAVKRDPFFKYWWPKTPGYPKMPGKVSKARKQHLEHLISQP